MTLLSALGAEAIFILCGSVAEVRSPVMLFSAGKVSTTMKFWLAYPAVTAKSGRRQSARPRSPVNATADIPDPSLQTSHCEGRDDMSEGSKARRATLAPGKADEDQIRFVLSHPDMSPWLKRALDEALARDIVDVVNDLEILNVVLRNRLRASTIKNNAPEET